MRKLLPCALMLAVMAAFATTSEPSLLAQPPKKEKETKKSKASAAAGTFEINEGKDGKFRFNIRNADGKYLAGSAAYASEKEARAAIDELREIVADAKIVKGKAKEEKKKDKDK